MPQKDWIDIRTSNGLHSTKFAIPYSCNKFPKTSTSVGLDLDYVLIRFSIAHVSDLKVVHTRQFMFPCLELVNNAMKCFIARCTSVTVTRASAEEFTKPPPCTRFPKTSIFRRPQLVRWAMWFSHCTCK